MAAVEGTNSDIKSRPPPLTQSDAITSLLSLSLAAANAAGQVPQPDVDGAVVSSSAGSTTTTTTTAIVPTTVSAAGGKHHRRLGSTGKTRRRLSDAREASARPLLIPTPTSSAALSLASLSLSTSPPSNGPGHGHSHSLGQSQSYVYPQVAIKPKPSTGQGIPIVSASAPNGGITILTKGAMKSDLYGASESAIADGDDEEQGEGGAKGTTPIPVGGKAKKRGVDYKCESCSKIYRHPNCLNKHRWEHTRQWREASKFVLSKHQQVQLLEAAAILSYMGTSSTSLPEDRSEWPSFLSGGSLPKTEPVGGATTGNPTPALGDSAHVAPASYGSMGQAHYAHSGSGAQNIPRTTTYPLHPHPISSSVPNAPSGPRMHDYSLPAAGAPVKVTQVRPGLLGVPTAGGAISTYAGATTNGHSITGRGNATGTAAAGSGGWSLPNSSVRSGSLSSSRSRSASVSRSRSPSGSGSRSDESLDIDVDVDGVEDDVRVAGDVGIKGTSGSFTGYPGYPTVSTTPGLSYSPGYGSGGGTYGTGAGYGGHVTGYGYGNAFARRGRGLKREDDEMSVGFSVREEDEDEEEDAEDTRTYKNKPENKWNGMEMEVDMDMD